MNDENLKKGKATQFRTGEEQVKIAQKGGIASGEARKERKLIKERILERMGETDWDEYIDGIITRSKETRADAEFLRDTIGEKPTDKIQVTEEFDQQAIIDEIEALILNAEEEPPYFNGQPIIRTF